ncbi:hypothetical protein TPHA_0K01850 [Tetrapisispora phaffii CBS 4417]|uniref:Uncharacterized protein n=1 Tax=Tetrapisispora phaffii (strain ATCC 24235 / CBS 4417 / NBRC 1672 / NRRL Y-8282 / UCD 70-5) TaxID=1071381 RepID=G8BZI9_TETPH|nr:hypothetical protein TPHA_0K01850 [Tetrapisispora phaffii CBS 4417]CCE65317.1 hypothetical protein TPHA_0K01850 [Tetrapisispora phaffii CBS 4417]
MLARTVLRRTLPASFKISNYITPVLIKQNTITESVIQKRTYAKSWDDKYENEDVSAHLKVQKLLDKIKSSEEVTEKLNKVQKILIEKGLVPKDGPTDLQANPLQIIKIFMNKELRESMLDLRKAMDKAGIELGQDQIGPIMTVLGMKNKN